MKPRCSIFFQTTGMGRVDDRQLVSFGDLVQGVHQREEMAFVVDVFFAVGGNQDVLVRRQFQFAEDLAGLDLRHVLVQDFAHR